MLVLEILLLLLLANGAPIIARHIFGERLQRPVDGGRRHRDGQALLGPSKTVLGVTAALLLTSVAAALLALPLWLGALIAAGAMTGDLASSYLKRRLGLPASSYAAGIDQVPEALLPTLLVMPILGITGAEAVLIVAAFVALELGLSALLYKARLRQQPY